MSQIGIWRDTYSDISLGIVEKIFFEILVDRFNNIVTDISQSERGKKMWIRLLGMEEYMKSLHAYFIDLNSGEIIPLMSQKDAIDMENDIWKENDKTAQKKLILITKYPL